MTLKFRSRSPKPIQLFIMSKCYIHANLVKICQLVREILKNMSRSPKPNHFFVMFQRYIHVQSGWNLPISSSDMVHTSTFWFKFGSLSPAVTLKIMSGLPKPNQLFIISKCYIHANLIKIHPLVHEISCIQESVTPTLSLMPTGSAPKTICPPPLWWGT